MRHTRRRTTTLILLSALLSGCATASTEEAFDQRISTYVGRSEVDLVSGLGVPNRSYDAPTGLRLLQYDFVSPAQGPSIVPMLGLGFGSFGSGVGIGTGLGLGFSGYGQPAVVDCSVIFELREGRVEGFSRRGSGCIAPVSA
ncbi:hypothetical protein [Roseomonas xinghualingensis]|uniref:hypothetical protein n=1 Tax=Roseomonas xinghualingensis TaxID=2986475 RepID=UPI0021F16198|nr:hypothetical protein [Roseomonas sp. SXEYE001]MCV4210417.1 hypothetical protein [Roseomonas sp. SXEYE001]